MVTMILYTQVILVLDVHLFHRDEDPYPREYVDHHLLVIQLDPGTNGKTVVLDLLQFTVKYCW